MLEWPIKGSDTMKAGDNILWALSPNSEMPKARFFRKSPAGPDQRHLHMEPAENRPPVAFSFFSLP